MLEEFVAASNPRWLRRDAAFWLGAARGDAGAAVVERLARTDADDRFREHLTFVLTLIGDRGIDTLITLARNDASAERARTGAVLAGPEGRRSAPWARSVAPSTTTRIATCGRRRCSPSASCRKIESVPKLIELARTHRDPEVRKQAMFWLGQSGDERAVQFFEEVLKN